VLLTRRTKNDGSTPGRPEVRDPELRELFATLRDTPAPSVRERSECGDIAREAILHLAARSTRPRGAAGPPERP
jgi:hypothetical protein